MALLNITFVVAGKEMLTSCMVSFRARVVEDTPPSAAAREISIQQLNKGDGRLLWSCEATHHLQSVCKDSLAVSPSLALLCFAAEAPRGPMAA